MTATTVPAAPARPRLARVRPLHLPRRFWVTLAVLLVVLDFGDTLTTVAGLHTGVAEEANPVAAAVFAVVGVVPGNLLLGTLFVTSMFAVAWMGARTRVRALRNGFLASVVAVVAVKALVVVSNTLVLTGHPTPLNALLS